EFTRQPCVPRPDTLAPVFVLERVREVGLQLRTVSIVTCRACQGAELPAESVRDDVGETDGRVRTFERLAVELVSTERADEDTGWCVSTEFKLLAVEGEQSSSLCLPAP